MIYKVFELLDIENYLECCGNYSKLDKTIYSKYLDSLDDNELKEEFLTNEKIVKFYKYNHSFIESMIFCNIINPAKRYFGDSEALNHSCLSTDNVYLVFIELNRRLDSIYMAYCITHKESHHIKECNIDCEIEITKDIVLNSAYKALNKYFEYATLVNRVKLELEINKCMIDDDNIKRISVLSQLPEEFIKVTFGIEKTDGKFDYFSRIRCFADLDYVLESLNKDIY